MKLDDAYLVNLALQLGGESAWTRERCIGAKGYDARRARTIFSYKHDTHVVIVTKKHPRELGFVSTGVMLEQRTIFFYRKCEGSKNGRCVKQFYVTPNVRAVASVGDRPCGEALVPSPAG